MNHSKPLCGQADSLIHDLRGYGLDPREWTIRPLPTRGLFSLDHNKTTSFRMLGRADTGGGKPQWLWLRLASF